MATDQARRAFLDQLDRADQPARWLPADRMAVSEDARGRLVLSVDRQRYEGVQLAKLFALTDPDRYVAFRDEAGEEIGILKDCAGLSPEAGRLVRRHLDRQYFIPIIQTVQEIREIWIDQIWTVGTDRGPREFTVQGRDSIRFLSDSGMLLIDTDDNRYLIPDRRALDPASLRWVDRYVW